MIAEGGALAGVAGGGGGGGGGRRPPRPPPPRNPGPPRPAPRRCRRRQGAPPLPPSPADCETTPDASLLSPPVAPARGPRAGLAGESRRADRLHARAPPVGGRAPRCRGAPP